jgi:Zn-dependent membrane protease YugP
MNDLRKIISYANFAALILYIVGRLMAMPVLCWIGLLLMTLSSIYTIVHWKENEKLSNYIAVAFLVLVGLSLLGI